MNSNNVADGYPQSNIIMGKRRIAHPAAKSAHAGAGGNNSVNGVQTRRGNASSSTPIHTIENRLDSHRNLPRVQTTIAQHGLLVNTAIALPSNTLQNSKTGTATSALKYGMPTRKRKDSGLEIIPAPAARLANRPKRNPTVLYPAADHQVVPFQTGDEALVPSVASGPGQFFEHTKLALDLEIETRYLENKIREFYLSCNEDRNKIAVRCLLKRCPGRPCGYGWYKILASTEPIPPENTFLHQKNREFREVVGTHGWQDQGYSSPEHGYSSEVPGESSDEYWSITEVDYDSDFVPGKRNRSKWTEWSDCVKINQLSAIQNMLVRVI